MLQDVETSEVAAKRGCQAEVNEWRKLQRAKCALTDRIWANAVRLLCPKARFKPLQAASSLRSVK